MPRIVAISMTIATTIAALTLPALAQTMTTAAEIRPILTATKPQWVAVRAYEGRDLVYFTNLLAWRCGVSAISYGLNGAAPDTALAMEPCYEGEASPNALKMDQGILPYIEADLGSVATVSLLVTYDDGSTDTAEYTRQAVLLP